MKKVYVIGVDQMNLKMVRLLAEQGHLPNLKSLLDDGSSNQLLPAFPAATAINWPTIATGADSGTHGVTKWHVDLPNGETIHSFWSHAVNAETIWEAAERAGIKSAVIHYPASAPPRAKSGYVVDGFASSGFGENYYEITPAKCYTTIDDMPVPQATEVITLSPGTGWKSVPSNYSATLESVIGVVPKYGGEDKDLHLLIVDSAAKGYDRALICREKDVRTAIAEIGVGEWSEWVFEDFNVEGAKRAGTLRFKLVELTSTGDRIRLYRSQVMPVDGFTHPDGLGRELIELFGPYVDHVGEFFYLCGATDFATWVEEADYQSQWIARAARYLVEEKECGLFYGHIHFLDDINHFHIGYIDPSWPGYDPAEAERHWEVIREAYKVIDRMIGTFLEGLDEDTYVLVVADHGNMPNHRVASLELFLLERGYLTLKDNSKPRSIYDDDWDQNIDFRESTAYMKAGDHTIYINSEDDDFEKIRTQLIRDLRTWVDPSTGTTPIALALKKEDAAIIGLWGESIGDIVVVLEEGYSSSYAYHQPFNSSLQPFKSAVSAAHGHQMLTSQSNINSSLAMAILTGPGVKKGYERPTNRLGYIKTKDVVPTLCHILNIQPPAQSQGAIAYDLFEGNEMERYLPSIVLERKAIDPRIETTEKGTLGGHHYGLVKKFPWQHDR